jgi:hypothetical protein
MGSYPTVCIEDARQLTSREAYLTLYPRHFSGLHNRHNTDIVEHDVTAIQTYIQSQQALTIEVHLQTLLQEIHHKKSLAH